MSDLTPMMKQYLDIKKKYSDTIIFFRLGDFYEMFNEDAKIASRVLQIALTSRTAGEGRQLKMPMCGVPFHAANSYIMKLINAGYKVAICEQMEDPQTAKGLVKREIVRIITPGTIIEEDNLNKKVNNYLLSFYIEEKSIGISYIDISTGEFITREFHSIDNFDKLVDIVININPIEILLPESYKENKVYQKNIIERLKLEIEKLYVNYYSDWNFQYDVAINKIKEHFKILTPESFGIKEKSISLIPAGALLIYVYDTQKTVLYHINKITDYKSDRFMMLDSVTIKNLEILDSEQKGSYLSLINVIDYTNTGMGSRELRKWLKQPLLDINSIKTRQEIVQYFINFSDVKDNIIDLLKDMADIERITGKLGSSNVNGRDLVSLKNSIGLFEKIDNIINGTENELLIKNFKLSNNKLIEIYKIIDEAIEDDPPITIKEGDLIKPSYNEELKKLKDISKNSKEWLSSLQENERKRTGINSLKVGYTSVFGYYIEVSKANLSNVPKDYIRKQTLVNAERFITPELKEYEATILGAEERIKNLEYEIFVSIRNKLLDYIIYLQDVSKKISELDCLLSLAEAAIKNNYVRPEITDDGVISIKDGRHPVVEKSLGYNEFIPNDTELDTKENIIMMITGPNMAGKSTYMRQVGLIVIMAQIGSFVPATSAKISIVDRVFTRVGAADYLARGQSTFMVEMIETANIINNATKDSLIILDEVGRGTSTFDGISIAWAITEYIHNRIKAKTLFATHYYELTEIADILPCVKNYNIQVKEWGDKIIFLRKIVKGAADKSYGIHVAQLAGLPQEILDKAYVILKSLEDANYNKNGKTKIGAISSENHNDNQMSLFDVENEKIKKELKEIDINKISPFDALAKLKELKDKYNL
ncbi:MAG: DNA mismatch repair protein MutS [Candidatus Goldbacteria bacterium]|nr:DNA mismatch repair protein MutS [Candidatus Goldiibacteriota bacterium]